MKLVFRMKSSNQNSMDYNVQILLTYIGLLEIFSYANNKQFLGITVISYSDLLQLHPMKLCAAYADCADELENLAYLWHFFKLAQLEVMRLVTLN